MTDHFHNSGLGQQNIAQDENVIGNQSPAIVAGGNVAVGRAWPSKAGGMAQDFQR